MLKDLSNYSKIQFKHRFYKSKKILKPWIKYFVFALLIGLFIYSIFSISINIYPSGASLFWSNLRDLFSFNQYDTERYLNISIWRIAFESLWKSIRYVFIGNLLGTILAMVTAIISYDLLVNKIFSKIVKTLLTILRAIPVIIFIMLITNMANKDMVAVTTFFWFTWIYLHKYFVEILENSSTTKFNTLINNGKSKFNAFSKSIWFEYKKRTLVLSLYSFEANMRWATVLGAAGIIGIGGMIDTYKENFQYIGIPLFVLMTFLIVLHIFSYLIKKYLIQQHSTKIQQNSTRKVIKSIKYVLIIGFIVISIFSLISFNYKFNTNSEINRFMNASLKTNWTGLFDIQGNIFLWIWDIFIQIYAILFITILLALSYLSLQIRGLTNKFIYAFFSLINLIFRIIPIYVIVLLINPIFDIKITFIIAIAIGASSSMTKKLTDTISHINQSKIQTLKTNGKSNWFIYKYIINTISKDIKTFSAIDVETNFKDLIFYGLFSGSVLGHKLMVYLGFNKSGENFGKAWAIIYVIIIVTIGIELISNLIRKDYQIKQKIEKLIYLKNKILLKNVLKFVEKNTKFNKNDFLNIQVQKNGYSKNNNYVLTLKNNKKYFIHIPNQIIDHKNEIYIYRNYYQKDFIYLNDNGSFIRKYFPAYEFDLNNKNQIKQLFEKIKQFHQIPTDNIKQKFGYDFYLKTTNINSQLLIEFKQAKQIIDKYPTTILHGDLNHKNIIYDDDFHLIDFEWISKGPFIIDFASIIAYTNTDINYWAKLLKINQQELIIVARMLLIHGWMWAEHQKNNKKAMKFKSFIENRLKIIQLQKFS